MNNDLDALARSAADALVSAMATDSWKTVKRRFAALVGDERRMDAIQAVLATSSATQSHEDLAKLRLALRQVWATRMRQAFDEDPRAADGMRKLLADLAAAPTPPARRPWPWRRSAPP